MNYKGVIERYRKYLPVSSITPLITLLEGNTPLLLAKNITRLLNNKLKVYLKYEGLNPTGSFKDRGMTLAVSKAKEENQKAIICASTGNTSASAASYAACAGFKCFVIVPWGNIALGKLSQALMAGAQILAIKGNFDRALEIVKNICQELPVRLVNSINPHRIEGQKTASFEICDTLGRAPDFLALPVGNAGNITAYWKGFKEYLSYRKIKTLPRILGFQAKGACPIVRGRVFKNPRTIATAIKIGNPASWQTALGARDESQGRIEAVSDKEILRAYKILAQKEGLFVEPASAASLAGVFKLYREGYFKRFRKGLICVSVLTGHGLKDPQTPLNIFKTPKPLPSDINLIIKAIKKKI